MISTRNHTRLCRRQLVERQLAHARQQRALDRASDLMAGLPLMVNLVRSKPGRTRIQVYPPPRPLPRLPR